MNTHHAVGKLPVSMLCLTFLLVAGCSKKEAPKQVTEPTANAQQNAQPVQPTASAPAVPPKPEVAPASAAKMVLPSPYGIHTDDLEGMMKRRNIRAIVIINPVGFFYSN